MEEHKILLQLSAKLNAVTNKVQQASDMSFIGDNMHNLEHITKDLLDAEKHYLREENVLFPMVEKHGITEPPAIMWTEHNQIRDEKKQLRKLTEDYNAMSF